MNVVDLVDLLPEALLAEVARFIEFILYFTHLHSIIGNEIPSCSAVKNISGVKKEA